MRQSYGYFYSLVRLFFTNLVGLAKTGKGTTKNYRLFVWLNEAGEDNNAEQGAIFKGTIHVDLPGANGDITGVAAGE